MLEAIELIKGAVSTKAIMPVYKHIHVYNGRMQCSNGKIAIDVPTGIDKTVTFTAPAERFVQCVKTCNGELNFKITPAQKLSVKNKNFKAMLTLYTEMFPLWEEITAQDKAAVIDVTMHDVLTVFKKLEPYVSLDASRAWSRAVMFKDDFAYATNNVIIARVPISGGLSFNVPMIAAIEMIRINKPILSIAYTDKRIQFTLDGGTLIHCVTIAEAAPNLAAIIVRAVTYPIPETLQEDIHKVTPFCEDQKHPVIAINKFGVSTAGDETGASVDRECYAHINVKFRVEVINKVLAHATHIDFSTYPKGCYFYGDRIEGVCMGVT